jgi:hypothetical protein
MPLPIIANQIRVSVYGTIEGGVGWSNTFHIGKDAGSSYANTMADNIVNITKLYQAAGFGGTAFGCMHFATDGTKVTSVVQTPLDGVTPSRTDNLALTGSSSQAALPAQTAVSVTLLTAIRGRSYRGRVYWPCNSREMVDTDGTFAAADGGFVESTWAAFDTALQAQTRPAKLFVASYKLGSAEQTTGTKCRLVYAHQTKRRGRGA